MLPSTPWPNCAAIPGTSCQPRNWEWFTINYFGSGDVAAGPNTWSQFGDGVNATIYLYPTPNVNQSLTIDVASFPLELESDAAVEAIPFPWTRCVKYYAAYLAYLGIMRMADADIMLNQFNLFMQQSRVMNRATVLPMNANSDWAATTGGNRGA